MKCFIIFLLPVAFAASVQQKRVLFDTFLNGEEGRHLIDQLVEQLGSDTNYAKCEQECHVLIRNQQSVIQHLCPFTCHLAIDAIKTLHSPSTNPAGTGGVAKRLVFDTFLNGEEGRHLIDQLVEQLGTDDNYAKCEQECHVLIRNQQSVMQHLCPFTCHLAIDAIKNLHSPSTNPAGTGGVAKRLVFDTFLNGEEGRHLIDQLVEQLGTDDNYAKCEQECHVLIRNQQSVMQHLCPFTCHLAIDAIKNLHSPSTNPAGTGAKRLVLGNFINTEETSRIIDQLVAILGADESEQACETHCHVLIKSSTSVFQHMCPFLCHSAQAIINSLGHHSTSVPPAPGNPAKRILLDTFVNNQEVTNIVDQLVNMLTSGTAYGACEKECHVLIRDQTSVVQHLCPFMCHSAQALIGNIHHTTGAA